MELNMYWKVFIEGNPNEDANPCNTNRLINVYTGEKVYICKFNGTCFVEEESGIELHFSNPVFWCYVPMLPNAVKTNVVEKCMKEDGRCEYEDDGYCFDKPADMTCQYCKVCFEHYAYNE